MKLFCFLFSTYILLLCSMPCTDICNENKDDIIKCEILENPVNPHENETCTPFCNCFCCGSIAVVMSVLSEVISTEFNSNKIFQPEIIKIRNVSFSVWQPPKHLS
ncbi:MAG: DUF6660 family protein [Bacteroidia bacterium]